MKIVEQSYEILAAYVDMPTLIERAGRTCYKSEDKITDKSARKFIDMIVRNGHHSVLEHGAVTVKFITNRGVTHELVRHRLASYSQESTRYVNYGGDDIEFIKPVWIKEDIEHDYYDLKIKHQPSFQWYDSMHDAEFYYKQLLKKGWRPEQAREVLPNSLKTEIVMTANVREWRHVFTLRCSKKAHPQIRELMRKCCDEFIVRWPELFIDLVGVNYE